jgi:hypothetical protein
MSVSKEGGIIRVRIHEDYGISTYIPSVQAPLNSC